jgi:polyisoprenoid-binding protein YceI
VNSFGCEAQDVTLDAKAANSEAIEATVDVAVAELECGRERMNRDLQIAMHAEEHPKITYYLESAFQTESSDNEVISINAIGFLRVAGVVRKVEVLATAIQSDDGSYRLSGSLPIRMTDYNIDPPRALAGLIRVHDDIVVQFDLTVAASTTSIH